MTIQCKTCGNRYPKGTKYCLGCGRVTDIEGTPTIPKEILPIKERYAMPIDEAMVKGSIISNNYADTMKAALKIVKANITTEFDIDEKYFPNHKFTEKGDVHCEVINRQFPLLPLKLEADLSTRVTAEFLFWKDRKPIFYIDLKNEICCGDFAKRLFAILDDDHYIELRNKKFPVIYRNRISRLF